MHLHDSHLVLSATDLSNFLGCRHRTALDMSVAHGVRERPFFNNPLLEILRQRGLEHESRYVDSLRAETSSIADLGAIAGSAERVAATLTAMRQGADVIVQGALQDGQWFGKPDIMRRVASPSAFGPWSYEIADTKLARDTRAATILQLGLYSEMLAAAQGARPARFHVVTPTAASPDAPASDAAPVIHSYRVDDYAAYVRLVRQQMLTTVASDWQQIAAANYPEPVELCEVCHWSAECRRRRRTDDHLSLVAGITRMQRQELETRSVTTLTGLARLPLPLAFTPKRGSTETYVRVREQARLQLDSRGRTPPAHEMLAIEAERGLCRLPEPTPGDLFLDLEGDPLALGGPREYLFGLAAADAGYRSAWALTDAGEKRGFEWVIDTIDAAVRAHPGMHVYHYAPYEPAAFKRLMGRHATRERELDAMLRAGRFVDLYAVTRQALRAGIERYSIKNLEPLYNFRRAIDLAEANRSLAVMEQGIEMGIPESVPMAARDTVEGYNRDDCLSTLRLRDWLEHARTALGSLGTDIPRPALAAGDPPPAVDERAREVEALRERLLTGIPEIRADRSDEQQGRWLLAYMLDYHRREAKATWWDYFRLCDLTEEELLGERDAVAGLELVERVDIVRNKKTQRPTGSVIDRYRYPLQEMEIAPGSALRLQDRSPAFGTVTAVDRVTRTIDIQKGPARAETHPRTIFAFRIIPSDVIEGALLRIGESIATNDGRCGAARALLGSRAPQLPADALIPRLGESATSLAVRIGGELVETVLAIQGPPGSGKTFCGGRMICELVRQGKRVGVTALSHRVIRKLLDEVAIAGEAVGVVPRIGEKDDDASEGDNPHGIRSFDRYPELLEALQAGEVNVVGGTAWLWSRPELASSVDVLFVDEAGQMALPNVVAVSQAASSLVLLGDPQQLEQPRKGSHPDGVDLSALEHLLAGRQTIPADRGIFLPATWRMAPSISAFTSELFYEGRLTSAPGLERQRLAGVGALPDNGLCLVAVDHDGNTTSSPEEIEMVAKLVAELTASGASWFDAGEREKPIGGPDVLVVAPYNAQVNRLTERLARTGARVGTVDKFQGQEAAVVLYSMTTSRPEDAPRGMELLYSLNRLNVATSRARCLVIVVASPRLFEPTCGSPRQMMLANGLCRYRELCVEVWPHHDADASAQTVGRIA